LWLWANDFTGTFTGGRQARPICHYCNGWIASADDVAAILIVPLASNPELVRAHRICMRCAPDEATALELVTTVRHGGGGS
jgi:hypothetical protein